MEEGGAQAKVLVGGGGCKALEQAGARYEAFLHTRVTPPPALLPNTWPPHLQVTSLSCDQGQGTGSTHGCSNTSGLSPFWLHLQNRLARSFALSLEGRQLEHHCSGESTVAPAE